MSITQLPTQLGPYRLLERLGFGGMCEVFLAECYGASGFVKRVAIKTLLTSLQGQGRYERLLIQEAKLGAQLTHRNIVQVHDLGVDRGLLYVCLEYVDGGDLRALMQAGAPLPQELALYIVAEVALALDYLHKRIDEQGRPLGLVHRDISPSNILLSGCGEVRLADLGVAKATKLVGLTQGQTRKGKYAYMSPEQIKNQPLEARSDLFGLGVTLMELLCGKRPYEGQHALETMELIAQAKGPPDLSAAPTRCHELLSRCLAPDPQDRYPDAMALYAAICHLQREQPRVDPPQLAPWVNESKQQLKSISAMAKAAPSAAMTQTMTVTRTGGHDGAES